jgi:predicted AlkP superfamily phosphohydrolase/phosphomutase/tetratricopeptide (TPR) repeat protein
VDFEAMVVTEKKKVLLVGWDAADWKMIHPLMDHGLMPNTNRLVGCGVMANLTTLSPVLSPMLWTSIATGKRPFKHGILGFTEPTPDGTAVQPVSGLSRKTKAIWNILNQEGRRSLVVGWWPSHPAEPINGVMVSNHYHRAPKGTNDRWPVAHGTVYPPRLAKELAELRLHPLELEEEHIRPFIPHAEKIDQDTDRRLDTCLRTIAECTTVQACITHLLETEPWDFAAVYFDAIDHFGHAFMKYHPPRQAFVSEEDFDIYQNVVSAGYVYHDMMLGRLIELAGEETTIILVSDHGFHPDHLRPDGMPVEPAGPAIEHRDLGIFAMKGPGIRRDQLITGATLLDVTPTILALLGLPVGEDMDGHPLLDAFEVTPEVHTIPSWDDVSGEDGRHAADSRLDPAESSETLEQLVALGYIEQPDDDRGKAVAKTMRELNYNQALAYMDAGMHPKAVEVLAELYHDHPLEFRFGIRLALCLQAMQMSEEMAAVVDHLNACWRKAAESARERLREIAELARERRKRLREEREAAADSAAGTSDAATSTASEPVEKTSRPSLFNEAEQRVVRELQAIARGNERTLDYLASGTAMSVKDHDTALAHLEKARESTTRTPGFHIQVGNAYLELKHYDDAEQSYRRVLELDPENPSAYVGLCRVALKRRQNRQALESAQTAVGLKYHFPPAHFFLGIAQHRMGEPQEAIESLNRAISQNPNFPEAHSRLAMIYTLALKDKTRAAEHRAMARHIRQERRRQQRLRKLPKLPPLEAIDPMKYLPEFPQPVETNLKPALANAPIKATDWRAEGDGRPYVTVVSGLPRSGTSMMLQMLVAGGLSAMTDGKREADDSNPRGYFELEKVKRLQTDNAWLDEARGKVIKVVAPLLPLLPQDCQYRVLLMERDLDEVVSSQGRMLDRLGREGGNLDDDQLRRALTRHLEYSRQALAAHRIPVLTIRYADGLQEPAATARRVAAFLRRDLDEAAMAQAVAPALYREHGG